MFQPTPTHGGRPPSDRSWLKTASFQPTPTHGGRRRTTRRPALSKKRFNPRPRTVGDPGSRPNASGAFGVSTHAHARWATMYDGGKWTGWNVSTHAHARWATYSVFPFALMCSRFNPRPRTVGDSCLNAPSSTAPSFNPRPRTVGDLHRPNLAEHRMPFQPTPTHGGRPAQPVLPLSSFPVSTHAHARWATF